WVAVDEQIVSVASDVGMTAIRVGLIFLGTVVVVWLVRRWLPRTVDRLVEERENDESNLDELRGSEINYLQRLQKKERTQQRTKTLTAVSASILSGVLWFVGGLLILGELQIDLAPLLAGAGVAGIAIGFGAQALIRDFLAGFIIVLEDQYAVGDVVDLEYATGEVERVTMRFTRLRDHEGKVWYIPNGEIRRVGNLSKLWSRAVLDIGIAYEDDIERAQAAMIAAANDVKEANLETATILDEPQVLGVQDFGPSSVVLRMAIKTEPGEQWAVGRAVRARIKSRFDSEGIEFPFAQSVIRVRNDEGQPTSPGPFETGSTEGSGSADSHDRVD
ncbi:MAG: mechanosensitive ion channel family protein, partial [Acidimicrobiia bacterium]|nr:mechanosensitive ion channel family protein [Acidimicrobiia bacterium]